MFDIFYRGDERLAVVVVRADAPKVGVVFLNPVVYVEHGYPGGPPLYCAASDILHITGFGENHRAARAELRDNIRIRTDYGIRKDGRKQCLDSEFGGEDWQHNTAPTYQAAMRKAEKLVATA